MALGLAPGDHVVFLSDAQGHVVVHKVNLHLVPAKRG